MKIALVFVICVPVFCWSASIPVCFCDKRDCEEIRASECPGLGILVKDPCGCCMECARTEGEPCGGELGFSGTCEPGLFCRKPGLLPNEGTCRFPSTDDEFLSDNSL